LFIAVFTKSFFSFVFLFLAKFNRIEIQIVIVWLLAHFAFLSCIKQIICEYLVFLDVSVGTNYGADGEIQHITGHRIRGA